MRIFDKIYYRFMMCLSAFAVLFLIYSDGNGPIFIALMAIDISLFICSTIWVAKDIWSRQWENDQKQL